MPPIHPLNILHDQVMWARWWVGSEKLSDPHPPPEHLTCIIEAIAFAIWTSFDYVLPYMQIVL